MGLDDICNTGLVLGLGISSNTGSAFSMADDLKPQRECLSLTLSLPGENYERRVVNKVASKTCKDQFAAGLYCQDSPASSFSSASVKREIDFGSNDDGAETERVSSRITNEDDDGSNGSGGRNKLRLTKAQSAFLEEIFKRYSTLNPKKKQEIARDLKLSARQVEVWFQNRRARTKLKQMEVNHELLKKCCESLTDENRRLQKEIQELKITLAPLYMQQPEATLTMCPSCEKIGQTTTKTPFTINPKHQFCNSFANPSAAC